jgi:hypothetical protein
VVIPDGPIDRVLAFMSNICLGSRANAESRGISLVEYRYDPADPPDGRAIIASTVNPQLFSSADYGFASLIGTDGNVYVYQCHRPASPLDVHGFGPCTVARAPVDGISVPEAYQVWTGSGWSSNMSAAAPMSLPPSGDRPPIPPGGFSVTYHEGIHRFVMVYSPWPAHSQTIEVRVANSPVGPWSEPSQILLPDCSTEAKGTRYYCYAAGAQPVFDTPNRLGLGYYDRVVEPTLPLGQYLVTSVPITAP